MSGENEQVHKARTSVANAASLLERSPAFRQLEPATQFALRRDLSRIQGVLEAPHARQDPYAFPLDTPDDLAARLNQQRMGGLSNDGATDPNTSSPSPISGGVPSAPAPQPTTSAPNPRQAATETLAKRAGALSDELNFPQFVSALVHGTFDAIVDATIRQMEAFANLVSAVAKDVDQFTRENITPNQARDHLAQKYGNDLTLDLPGPQGGQPQLRAKSSDDGMDNSPEWLSDFGLEGETLTDDLVETELVPRAQRDLGQQRLQMLATMVLLGMDRVIVKDGTISAKVQFRATAKDTSVVNYAVGQDPNQQNWGERGNATYDQSALMVSTVGVNVQADTELNAQLFGEVRVNFASETLPLDQFMDTAKLALIQRNARKPMTAAAPATNGQASPPPALAPAPPASAPVAVAAPAAPATTPAAAPPVAAAPAAATPAPAGGG